MKYGVDKVVGGFAPHVRNTLPYAIARTRIELSDLHTMLVISSNKIRSVLEAKGIAEFGAGYGRLMSLSDVGFERDDELRAIAQDLGHDVRPFPVTGTYDVGITFTFLQHLDGEELTEMVRQINEAITDTLILCEAEPPEDFKDCRGRSAEEYGALFPEFELVHTQPRRIECNRTGVGQYMVFKRKRDLH